MHDVVDYLLLTILLIAIITALLLPLWLTTQDKTKMETAIFTFMMAEGRAIRNENINSTNKK